MKRKILLSSALIPALLGSAAMGQVVNFHDSSNGDVSFPSVGYDELFVGQGAYSDPGNDIWNGFGQTQGYGSTFYYSGAPGSGSGPWPQPPGDIGNPYAAYNAGAGWVTSSGTSLFVFGTSTSNTTANATSSGQVSPITLTLSNYVGDSGQGNVGGDIVPNGAPSFLLGEAAVNNGSKPAEVFTLNNVPAGTYGLYLYGANYDNNRGTAFSLNSGTAHNGISATLNNQVDSPAQTFVEGQNFVIFQNVTPNGSNQIVITATPNGQDGSGNTDLTGETDVNGFQLIYNPPPTAVASTPAQNVFAGGTASFSFSPAFATSPTFRWQSVIGGVTNNLADGGNISGSGTTNLVIANVSAANVGLYQCLITGSTGANTSPAAPLTILTNTGVTNLVPGESSTLFGNVLSPSDPIYDFGNNTNPPYNSMPPPFVNWNVSNAIDGTLYEYENFGANGSVPPFAGPVGFVVTPTVGSTVVTALRILTSPSHPEDDPADYLLEGSQDGTNFTAISGGLLGLPAQRNAAGGPVNITNDVLKEIDFANGAAYTVYRLTFTNVNNDTTASNGVQICEVQLLGKLAAIAPTIVTQPEATETLLAGATLSSTVVAGGSGPFTYQWYANNSAISGATNATLTVPNLTTAANGTVYDVKITNPSGTSTSSTLTLSVVTPTPYQQALLQFNPMGYWPLEETSGTIAYDYVGGYNGTYVNPSEVTLAQPGVPYTGFGSPSYSAQFLGGYVDIPEGPFNITNVITLIGWINLQYNTEFCSILGHGDTSYRLSVNGSGDPGFADGNDNGDATSPTTIVNGDWHMITGVYSGGSGATANGFLYVDGVLMASNEISSVPGNDLDVWLGGAPDYGASRLLSYGLLAHMAIIPQALTASQVQALYSASGPAPTVSVPTSPVSVDQNGSVTLTAVGTGAQPLYYQWYYLDQNNVNNLIAGATNSSLTLNDVQTSQQSDQYYVVVSNSIASATSAYVTLSVASGPPTITAQLTPLNAIVLVGTPINFTVSSTGTQPFTYQWYENTSAISGATNSDYTAVATAGSNNYDVVVGNAGGSTTSSMAAVVGVTSPPTFTFNGSGGNWVLNGSGFTPTIVTNLLTLTTSTNSEATSAFYADALSFNGFVASFSYMASGPGTHADGVTFCIQNSPAGVNALGGGGGSLGYAGITPSAAFEINIYSGDHGGVGYQFGTDGNVPDTDAGMGNFINPSPVEINSGDPIDVVISYFNDTLNITLSDPIQNTSYSTSYTTNLTEVIGSSAAYVGFTGATGGSDALQTVSNFSYSFSGAPTLTITRGAAGSVVVSWPVSVSSSFVLQQSTTVSGPWTDVTTTPTVVNGQNQVTLSPGTTTAFYRLVVP